MTADDRLIDPRFPRAAAYDPEWIVANASGGANALWLTEWLAEAVELRPGMRVRAFSSRAVGSVLPVPA